MQKKTTQKRKALQPTIDNYKKDLSNFTADVKLYKIGEDLYREKHQLFENELALNKFQHSAYELARRTYNSHYYEGGEGILGKYPLQARLNAERARLRGWYKDFNDKKGSLGLTEKQLDNYKKNLKKSREILISRYEHLKYQLNAITGIMGEAYKQLEILQKYTKEINIVFKKWKEPVINTHYLNTQYEQLKYWRNKRLD